MYCYKVKPKKNGNGENSKVTDTGFAFLLK